MGMGGVIDLVFLASGCYLIWTAISAKRRGSIVADVMLGKNITENHVKDKEGFIEYMYKRLILAGVLIVAASLVHLVNDYFIGSYALTWVGILGVLGGLALYTAAYMRGQKKYIGYISTKGRKQSK